MQCGRLKLEPALSNEFKVLGTWYEIYSLGGVSRSEVLGRFYNPNTTPKDKERVVVCLRGTG